LAGEIRQRQRGIHRNLRIAAAVGRKQGARLGCERGVKGIPTHIVRAHLHLDRRGVIVQSADPRAAVHEKLVPKQNKIDAVRISGIAGDRGGQLQRDVPARANGNKLGFGIRRGQRGYRAACGRGAKRGGGGGETSGKPSAGIVIQDGIRELRLSGDHGQDGTNGHGKQAGQCQHPAIFLHCD